MSKGIIIKSLIAFLMSVMMLLTFSNPAIG